MLDIGWQELLIVVALGIIITGPKDLPGAMRAVAGWVRKARSLAREFQGGLDDIMQEAELDDVKNKIQSTQDFDIAGEIESAIDPDGEFANEFDMGDIEADLDAVTRTEPPEKKPAAPSDDAEEEKVAGKAGG